MDEAVSIETIADLLGNLGYRAKIHDSGAIESATSGLKFRLRLHEDDSIQFLLSVQNINNFSYEDANEFNKKYRFGKSYLDQDKDIILEYDLVLKGMDFQSTLERCILLWDGIVSLFVRELQERAGEADKPA